MYRRRKFLGRYSKPKKNYQIMRPWWVIQGTSQNGYQTIIDPTTVTGVRKTKNFSIEFGNLSADSDQVIVWALVYVPSGYTPNKIGDPGATVYTPTNNVIMSGIYDSADPGNTSRRMTRLSRLLNAGDGIALVYKSSANPAKVRIQVTYAIAL
uniref:Capsid protein n=1 Tax=unidentified TaxID=32644 RepID=A0A6G9W4A9_9ZZZZ|nr:hypothetical protein [unidentified]